VLNITLLYKIIVTEDMQDPAAVDSSAAAVES